MIHGGVFLSVLFVAMRPIIAISIFSSSVYFVLSCPLLTQSDSDMECRFFRSCCKKATAPCLVLINYPLNNRHL